MKNGSQKKCAKIHAGFSLQPAGPERCARCLSAKRGAWRLWRRDAPDAFGKEARLSATRAVPDAFGEEA